MNEYKQRMRVCVKELKNSKTELMFGLDRHGRMKEMAGKQFKIESLASMSVRLYSDEAERSFRFHMKDIEAYEKDPEPIIFEFNPELLDIAHDNKHI